MKRLPCTWQKSKLDLTSAGAPNYSVLVPQTDAEREELLHSLDDLGVRDRMSFNNEGVNATLSIPAAPQWSDDGAVELTVTDAFGQHSPMWFWIVELPESPPRHVAWCHTRHDRDSARPWST